MNKFVKVITALLLFTAAVGPLSAQAQGVSPVTLSGDVKVVETTLDASGAETNRLVDPGVIVPGDRLIFGTDYANTGTEVVENFVVTNPLPGAVRLASDADPQLTVSVDGGQNWGTLTSLSLTNDDGTVRAATHDDVTHVRWTLAAIAPGASGRLEYPAIIR